MIARTALALCLAVSLAACGPDDTPPRWVEVCVESHLEVFPRFIKVGNSMVYSPLYISRCGRYETQCVWGDDYAGEKVCKP